jgi:hypothetical protein
MSALSYLPADASQVQTQSKPGCSQQVFNKITMIQAFEVAMIIDIEPTKCVAIISITRISPMAQR